MSANVENLATLLAPTEPGTFLGNTWERDSLLIRREQRDYYRTLFSLADVDRVIAFSRPRFPDPAAFRTGAASARTYVQGWHPDQQPADDGTYPGLAEVRRAFAQGKTLVVMGMQQRWPAVATLCRNLEEVFHCPVHANLYLTPAGTQGFSTHFDTHEVFVLQLAGSKRWRLYGPAAAFPLATDPTSVSRQRFAPPNEVPLEAGDLLYMPRGYAHDAFSTEETSLHLTIGVNVYRWLDLLHHALNVAARKDARFRESLPPGSFSGHEPADLAARFRELFAHLAETAPFGEALAQLGTQFFDQLTVLPDNSFASATSNESLDLDTIVQRRPGAVCRVFHDGGQAVVEFPGGRVAGPLKITSALRFIAGAAPFRIRELPDDLGNDAKLTLTRRLIAERLLVESPESMNDGMPIAD